MRQALEQAEQAHEWQEVPVGAVLVKNAKVIGTGCNQSIRLNDPTAHAEILAIRMAAQVEQNYRLPNTTLYVTLEPCAMCAGTLVHARIERLVYGASDPRTGAISSVFTISSDSRLNHQIQSQGGVLEAECSSMLREFFQQRRG